MNAQRVAYLQTDLADARRDFVIMHGSACLQAAIMPMLCDLRREGSLGLGQDLQHGGPGAGLHCSGNSSFDEGCSAEMDIILLLMLCVSAFPHHFSSGDRNCATHRS